MRELLRKWLGIKEIDDLVGRPEEKKKGPNTLLYSFIVWDWDSTPKTLSEKYERLKQDFEELDHKFDLLERYLSIELIKQKTENQTYDWADKKEEEYFRKTKSYEATKKEI